MDNIEIKKFIQQNSPDGGFLQSENWRKFQEAAGRKTYKILGDNFYAGIIEHKLPILGKYFYIPRGPVIPISNKISNTKFQNFFDNIINLAKKEKVGWVRIDVADKKNLNLIKKVVCKNKNSSKLFGFQIPRMLYPLAFATFSKGGILKIRKAPHNMQPKEIFIVDITKSEEKLLAEMKSKTRYNIRLAKRRGVFVKANSKSQVPNSLYVDEFLRLVKTTSKRNKIKSHPDNYYIKMLETIPEKNLRLYVAKYKGVIIAANIISFYGSTVTYLHGASDNKYRNVMAPYLLQWRAIKDAKKMGYKRYDMGGIKISNFQFPISNQISNPKSQIPDSSWAGITRFKLSFSPQTKPIIFPGSYDIVISSWKYWIYRIIQKVKSYI